MMSRGWSGTSPIDAISESFFLSLGATGGVGGLCDLATAQQQGVEEALSQYDTGRGVRQPEWSEALAVGSQSFSEKFKERLGLRATCRTSSGPTPIPLLKIGYMLLK